MVASIIYNFQTNQAPLVLLSLLKKDQDTSGSAGMKSIKAITLLGAGVSWLLSFTTIASADESEPDLECPSYPWPHQGILR
ncbi:cytochrome c1-2, heme protein, mitochondrial [Tanacetum coccineum]